MLPFLIFFYKDILYIQLILIILYSIDTDFTSNILICILPQLITCLESICHVLTIKSSLKP